MTPNRWTVVARSTSPGHWHYTEGWSHDRIYAHTAENTVIVMHRKGIFGWELVAQPSGPAWRRWQLRGKPAR